MRSLGRGSMLWTEEQRRYLDSKLLRRAKFGLAATSKVVLSRGEVSTSSWMGESKSVV